MSSLEPIVIDKNRALLPAQDYNLLREQGLEYVRSLSGRIWTDHNAHDPGITILEVLCYALTDLGYRTDFNIRDLLTAPDGKLDPPEVSGLFPAHEVLPAAPLTINDYRRLLAKVEGVRNAWLDPTAGSPSGGGLLEGEQAAGGPPVYADCQAGRLTFAPESNGEANPLVPARGRYTVLLEMEIDDRLGALNETRLIYRVTRGPLKGVVISIDSREPAFLTGKLDFTPDFDSVDQVVAVNAAGDDFTARIRINTRTAGGAAATVDLDRLVVRVLNAQPRPDQPPLVVNAAGLAALLADDELDGPIAQFWEKQQRRQRTLAHAACVLHANRSLCEDFYAITAIQAEPVIVCADIDLVNDADIEAVQARIFHTIEQYLNPPLRFFTLRELLDSGMSADEIFNGPYIDPAFTCGGEPIFTKPGFILETDLERSELRTEIYTSDIINLLMDFPEVRAVRNVLLRKADAQGRPTGLAQKWRLPITANRQPVLQIETSKLLFFKDQTPFRARPTEFEKTLDQLRAAARKAAYGSFDQTLPILPGRYRSPEAFFSIQHDFPRTYGIGTAGLPSDAEPGRVAQARQLKAYLTFFDQLLADYLAQLGSVRRFFSLDANLKQTYFTRYLDQITGVRADFPAEFYLAPAELQNEQTRTRLTEDESLYLDRRNRILDHLTARFAEQFTDYVLMMYSLEGSALQQGDELIADKIAFLKAAPVVSRERSKAFNYRPEDPAEVWDTDNVSGLEKRIARLLGIADERRRNLACAALFELLFKTRRVQNAHRVEIKDAAGGILFKSIETFPNQRAALDEARKLFPVVHLERSYQVDSTGGPNQVFYILRAGPTSLRHDALFPTEADAVQSIRQVLDRYEQLLATESACDNEGFHLIEHLLLRPVAAPADPQDSSDLLEACVDPGCDSCGDEDPYSFRIQVILPYWPRRFRNRRFRAFFEKTLRQETPAHIHARICWVSNPQMAELDRRYRRWLEAKAAVPIDITALAAAQRELVVILKELKTVYPTATLHDCLEDEDENVVRLGFSNLGLY